MIHTLRVHRLFFDDIKSGEVPFLICVNDRSLVVGDTVRLICYGGSDPSGVPSITGRISYYFNSAMHPGITLGYILLGLEDVHVEVEVDIKNTHDRDDRGTGAVSD